MKDVIKEILEANEKAKNDIENVEKLKLESAQRVKDMLNSRRLEYIDKAKMNIKVIKKIEVSKAEVEMKRIEKECEDILGRIKKNYLKNKVLWVNTIVNNVVSVKNVVGSNNEKNRKRM